MVANERELSPLRVAVVLFSIHIIFFLYHVVLSNPGYVTTTAVIPLALKVLGKLGGGMEAAAWWLVHGYRPSFVARSVLIPSVVDPTRLSAGATSPDGTVAGDIVGSPVLLPVNYLLSDGRGLMESLKIVNWSLTLFSQKK